MIRKLQGLFLILFIPVAGLLYYADKHDLSVQEILYPADPVMHIGDYAVYIDIADTPETRERGLSGRNDLGGLNGLLFIFDQPDYHGIWMKEMKFAIDVIWISEDLEVIGITENLTPDSYPRIFEPPKKALYAVETNPGYAETLGINVGDKVTIPNKYLR